MPTFTAIVRDIIQRDSALGRTAAITSLTTTPIVCNSLLFGLLTAEKFRRRWLWRLDTATAADAIRGCTNFTSSTGTLTHAGTNYADTTATAESVDILEYEPYLFRDAIQTALGRARHIDATEFPNATGLGRFSLHDLTWAKDTESIATVVSFVRATN